MPLIVPPDPALTATEVWAHTPNRRLTNLADARAALIDLITALRMAELDPANMPGDIDAIITAAAAILADTAAIDTRLPAAPATEGKQDTLITRIGDPSAHTLTSLVAKLGDPGSALDQAEFEQTYAIDNQTPQNWNDTAEHTMYTLSVITVGIPSGATLTRETLLMVMDIMALEAPGGVNKIDVEIEARKAAGSWTVFWTENDVLSLPDVDGARDSLVMIADVTGLFSTAGTYEFRAKVQASLAKDTQYLYTGIYLIRYKMG